MCVGINARLTKEFLRRSTNQICHWAGLRRGRHLLKMPCAAQRMGSASTRSHLEPKLPYNMCGRLRNPGDTTGTFVRLVMTQYANPRRNVRTHRKYAATRVCQRACTQCSELRLKQVRRGSKQQGLEYSCDCMADSAFNREPKRSVSFPFSLPVSLSLSKF